MAHALDQIKIADGQITLYKRDDVKDGLWQCRLKMPSKKTYVRRSTGETEIERAKQKAFEIFGELKEREKNQLPLSKRLFGDICTSYLRKIEFNFKHGRISNSRKRFISGAIRLYLNPYFSKKDIGQIRQQDVSEYRRWRMDYWVLGPGSVQLDAEVISSPPMFFDKRPNEALSFKLKKHKKKKKIPTTGTMALEWSVFRAIMFHGVELGVVKPHVMGLLKHDKIISNKRPAFSNADYRALYLFMRKWVKENISPRQKEIRQLLREYILIMANSGLRNGEARYLKWSDVSIYKKNDVEWLTLNVKGKTGQRIVVCQPNTMRYFNRLKERGFCIDPDDYVFCYSDGKPVEKPSGFDNLLKLAGLSHDRFGQKHTIYSLRHTYATFRIQNGTNIYWLKKNMGTSIEMIEKHYGQITVLQGIEHETAMRPKRLKPVKIEETKSDNLESTKPSLDLIFIFDEDSDKLVPIGAVDSTHADDDEE